MWCESMSFEQNSETIKVVESENQDELHITKRENRSSQ
jgi:hypothetical protein